MVPVEREVYWGERATGQGTPASSWQAKPEATSPINVRIVTFDAKTPKANIAAMMKRTRAARRKTEPSPTVIYAPYFPLSRSWRFSL